jgi:leucyl aminopeptidase
MWKLPLLEARTSIAGSLDTEMIAVFQDSNKKAISPKGNSGNLIEKLRKADAFSAKLGGLQYIRFAENALAENIAFLGLGLPADLTEEKLRVAGGNTWSKLSAERSKVIAVQVDSFFDVKGLKADVSPVRWVRAFAEGLVLNAYQFNQHKTQGKTSSDRSAQQKEDYFGPSKFIFFTQDKDLKAELDRELSEVQAIGESVRVTRDWSNQPSNIGHPVFYANEAKKLAKQYGLKCKILTENEAAREKMGLLLGVGQGSERESRIVVIEYTPKVSAKALKDTKTVALVGKGVTFDSGGISIKPSARMEEMKHDMTGAATVMGAVLLAASWKVKNRVIGVMAFVENMPSGNAIQPGNVIAARNGKTVEVINTDAEGRLILADVLDYVQDMNPDAVIDVATLTGAVSIALGKQCCAILGNDDTLIEEVRRAGEMCGERIWQLPLYDEYFEDLKSESADMKNSANDGHGGTIRGAIFLKQFIRKSTQWAHLDIAAMAYNVSHLAYLPKRGASGIYVRTLAQFIAGY